MKNPVFPRLARFGRSEPVGRRGALWGALLCGLTALTISGSAARAATYEVTASADSGPGTLREAINLANANAGADLIQFRGFTGFSPIDAELPAINGDVTIRGVDDGLNQGRSNILGSNGDFRVFSVAGGDVTIANFEISDGKAQSGGAVSNAGAGRLTLLNVKFSKNQTVGAAPRDPATGAATSGGGAVYSRGPVVARGCVFEDNAVTGAPGDASSGAGGAILVSGGALEVRDCRFSSNRSAYSGGAIALVGAARASIASSTFERNRAGTANFFGSGGALDISGDSFVQIVGCTMASNSAALEGGAVRSFAGTLVVDGTTFSNNLATGIASNSGGAISILGRALTVRNSSFVGNAVSQATRSRGGAISVFGSTVNLQSTSFRNNASGDAGGAIELFGGSAVLSDVQISADNQGSGSKGPLRGGGLYISAAHVFMRGGSISGQRASADGGAIWSGQSTLRVDGTTFSGNTASGGMTDEGGGAIFNDGGTLVVRNAQLANNVANGAAGSGGAIFNNGGRLELTNSLASSNFANRAGGAIETRAGARVTAIGTAFSGNFAGPNGRGAPGNGGALHLSGADNVSISNCNFGSNAAANQGGALWNSASGVLLVSDSTLSGNTVGGGAGSGGSGGAIYSDGGTTTVRNSTLRGNTAFVGAGSGGAIFNGGGSLNVQGGGILSNGATRAGGGIETVGGRVVLNAVNMVGNAAQGNARGDAPGAPGNGGALHVTGDGQTFVSRGSIVGNRAQKNGGGLWISSAGRLIVDGTSITGNEAAGVNEATNGQDDSGGGGIYGDGGAMTVRNATLTGNTASGGSGLGTDAGKGGGLLNKGGALQVIGSTFSGNSSQSSGGAIATVGTGGAVLQNSIFRNNSTTGRIGGGNAGGGAFHMADADTVFIVGSTFEGNSSLSDGGALANQSGGTFNITSSLINNNQLPAGAAGESGGIYNSGGTLDLRDVVVSNNKSSRSSGGGIINIVGTLIMRGGRVSGNSSQFSGGGIQNFGGKVTLVDVTLSSNSVSPDQNSRGGALDSSGSADGQGSVLIVRGEISNNSAGRNGGGLYSNGAILVVDGTSIVGNKINGVSGNTNSAGNTGGGIYNQGGALTVRNARLESNEAGAGGAILNNGGKASITNTILRGNKANSDTGGAIASSGSLVIGDSTLQDNQAASAGGAIENTGDLTLIRCTIAGNKSLFGGGLRARGQSRTFVLDSTISGNAAENSGGGVSATENTTLSIRNSTIEGNRANGGFVYNGGGGICNQGGFVTLDSVTLTGNSGRTGGGVLTGQGLNGTSSFRALNSVIALNTALGIDTPGFESNSNVSDLAGPFNSLGYNFIGIAAGITARSGDLLGTQANPLDPKLGELGNNGGPTPTRSPQSGSPLIDAGNTSAQADQRGVARPQGARKSIGAVEAAGASAPSSSAQSALKAADNAPSGGSS